MSRVKRPRQIVLHDIEQLISLSDEELAILREKIPVLYNIQDVLSGRDAISKEVRTKLQEGDINAFSLDELKGYAKLLGKQS